MEFSLLAAPDRSAGHGIPAPSTPSWGVPAFWHQELESEVGGQDVCMQDLVNK